MITVRELNRALLQRQQLLERSSRPPVELIGRLIALQAQATHPPYTALWNRLAGFTPSVLDQLVTSKQVARLALFRSTIHLVAADDALPLRHLLDPFLVKGFPAPWRRLLDGRELAAIVARGIALTSATPLTYAELGALLAAEFDADPRALAMVVRNLAPMVAVPPSALWGSGRPPSYQPAPVWLGAKAYTTIDRVALLRRYLAAYGPATVGDITGFTGITGFPAALAELADELITLDGPAGALYDLPDAPRPTADTPAPVRLMAEWDSALLAHGDRARIVPPALKPLVYTKNGVIPGTVLIDGFVAGSYRWRATDVKATLTLQPWRRWTKCDIAAVEREALAFLEFAAPQRTFRVTVAAE